MPRRNRHPAVQRAVTSLSVAIAIVQTGSCAATLTSEHTTPRPTVASVAPLTGLPTDPAPQTSGTPALSPVPASHIDPDALAKLPKATTFGTTPAAPADPEPRIRPSGLLVHPQRTVPAFAKPGGRPIAAVPPTQLGAPTWLPVIDRRPGWLRVLLPSRPNGSTAWLHQHPARVQLAQTPYVITVDRAKFRLTLRRAAAVVGSWTAGIGKPDADTPAGRTFVLANVHDTEATFSDIILPLGAHSDTHTRYGGGPGTVGIHTWPTSDGFGTRSSDGCIRIPNAALSKLSSTVPLGTPVLIR